MAENSSDTEDQQDHRGQQQSRSTGRQPAPKAAAKSPAKPTPKPAPKPASTSAKAAPRSDQPSRARSGSGGDGSSTSASGGPDGQDGQDGQGGQRSSDAHEHHHHGDGSRPRLNGRRAARLAALELAELTGKEFEGVVGIRKVDDEWHVEIEVLEMERIPSTTDVLAVYEVSLDASGELVGYERTARYVRGDAGEDRR